MSRGDNGGAELAMKIHQRLPETRRGGADGKLRLAEKLSLFPLASDRGAGGIVGGLVGNVFSESQGPAPRTELVCRDADLDFTTRGSDDDAKPRG